MLVLFLNALSLSLGAIALFFTGYLLTLLFASLRKRVTPSNNIAPYIAIVIPAHNENAVIHQPLETLAKQTYPKNKYTVYVIADNCTDGTAEIARKFPSVTVWERTNDQERGKGYALDWAFSQLLQDKAIQAFCIIDADTQVAPDFLEKMTPYLPADGSPCAAQGRYGVANTQESWRSALMSAAFDLVNHLRLLGSDNLGGFIGLKGNGMLFSRQTFDKVKWGRSITEDLDYSLDMLAQGFPIRYVPEARVTSAMPTGDKQARSQRDRWERGRYALVKERGVPLFFQAIASGNGRKFDAAMALLTPPLAELVLLIIGTLVITGVVLVLGGTGALVWLTLGTGLLALLGVITYVLGGLRLSGASPDAYKALLRAPFYMIWKIALYVINRGKKDNTWVRTERTPDSAEK
jgi:1,2-diacylglycerol 3-beta-glucosyltransferase